MFYFKSLDIIKKSDTFHPKVCSEHMKERSHMEDQGLDGRIISEFLLNSLERNVDLIDQSQDRDKWRVLLDKVIHLRDP
jgi:hypothetical protein